LNFLFDLKKMNEFISALKVNFVLFIHGT